MEWEYLMATKSNGQVPQLVQIALDSKDNMAYTAAIEAAGLMQTVKSKDGTERTVYPKAPLAQIALSVPDNATAERAAITAGHTVASFSSNAPDWPWFFDAVREYMVDQDYYDGCASDMILAAVARQYLGYNDAELAQWKAERAEERKLGRSAAMAKAQEAARREREEGKAAKQELVSANDLIEQLKAKLAAAGLES
jgi:hypothetical protein